MTLSAAKNITLAIAVGLSGAWIAADGAPAEAKTKYNFSSEGGGKKVRYKGKRTVKDPTGEKPGTIVIHTKRRKLYFVLKGGKAIEYGIGVGRRGFTWYGTANVKRKTEWPAWHPPREMIEREKKLYGRTLPEKMEGGVRNPLGARALYLFQGNKDTLYRIHGTSETWSIGKAASSGCVRMLQQDVIDLYNRVPEGTPITVYQV